MDTGAANAWSVMAVDAERDLVFVPTGSASPDYYGGLRPGDNKWANSVVALHAKTGQLAWGFQLVHHDLWDYDTASPPLLATIPHDGKQVDVVIQGNKTGFLYVLNRDTGDRFFPSKSAPFRSPTSPANRLAYAANSNRAASRHAAGADRRRSLGTDARGSRILPARDSRSFATRASSRRPAFKARWQFPAISAA